MGDLKKLSNLRQKNHQHIGFIDLIKDISKVISPVYFEEHSLLLAPQDKIQTLSYAFAERCFSSSNNVESQGKQMQLYVTKIDINEIALGSVDLSSPNLHNKKYNNEQLDDIFEQNNSALAYLKQPFSNELISEKTELLLSNFYKSIKDLPIDRKTNVINEFLNLHQNLLNEVVLFSEILGLICTSQSLYAFSYQIKKNQNFAKFIELTLLSNNNFDSLGHIERLAERFFSIFIGNLAARVFSNPTLNIIEQAFSIKDAK